MYYAVDRGLSQEESPSIKFNFRGGRNGLPLIEKLLKYEKEKEKKREKHLLKDNIFNDNHINYVNIGNNENEDDSPIRFSSIGEYFRSRNNNSNNNYNCENEIPNKYCIGYEESPNDDWNNEINSTNYNSKHFLISIKYILY
jgi:hypothetical protein